MKRITIALLLVSTFGIINAQENINKNKFDS